MTINRTFWGLGLHPSQSPLRGPRRGQEKQGAGQPHVNVKSPLARSLPHQRKPLILSLPPPLWGRVGVGGSERLLRPPLLRWRPEIIQIDRHRLKGRDPHPRSAGKTPHLDPGARYQGVGFQGVRDGVN